MGLIQMLKSTFSVLLLRVESNLSSDSDILIVTKVDPAKVHLELWRAGVKEPF